MHRSRGLTLIELLIAMAIFAVMSASIFVAFNSFQKTKEVTDKNAELLKRYQLAFNIIARDVQQMAPRQIRDEFGGDIPLAALVVNNDPTLEFTRAGWNRSPFLKVKRAELQRVAYYVEDTKLYRSSWRVLDRAQDTVPTRSVLLKGVERIRFEMHYQDEEENWKNTEIWPTEDMINDPMGSGNMDPTNPPATPRLDKIQLPTVIDIKLETEHFGEINRKFLIASFYHHALFPDTFNVQSSGAGGSGSSSGSSRSGSSRFGASK